jgi:DinB superfamily
MQPASAVDIQPAVSLLGKTPQLLETLLGDLPGELLHWKPRPDRWSISEVLAHLAALEQVYAERVLRIMAEDSPPLAKYDLDGAKALALLAGLPPSAGARTAVHSELGTVTLVQLLNEWANHDLGHLRQISELYRARAFHPHSGPFMKYSNPQP